MQVASLGRRQRSAGLSRQSPVAVAASSPTAAQAVDVLAPVCRICWQEADADEGGTLLSPCRCSGSSRFVHQRCLAAWMAAVAERKSVHAALHCDICRARYTNLPPELILREAPLDFLRRQAQAALATPAGNAASYYAAAALTVASVWGAHGAVISMMRTGAVVAAAQRRPLEMLHKMLPELMLSMASEACLGGHWTAPLKSAYRYLQGFMLEWCTAWTEANAVPMLPLELQSLAQMLCMWAKSLAMLVEYAHMGLLLLFGGLAKGFIQGLLFSVWVPAKLAGRASTLLRHGAAGALHHGMAALAGLSRMWSRDRKQRKCRQQRRRLQKRIQRHLPTMLL